MKIRLLFKGNKSGKKGPITAIGSSSLYQALNVIKEKELNKLINLGKSFSPDLPWQKRIPDAEIVLSFNNKDDGFLCFLYLWMEKIMTSSAYRF